LIIDLLKNWAKITEEDSEVASFTKLESAIRTTYPEALGEILPFVATLMGIKLVGRYAERMKGVEGGALDKIILKNVRDLITRGTQRAPLIVILEDLHWADASSIELIESLFRLASKERIVFINVFRPGYTDTGDRITMTILENYPEKYTEVTIQPLNEKQTETLIMNLLNIRGFPNRLKDQIIKRAGGNPYFIEEVVRSFIDEGAVVMKEGSFEVTEKLGSMTIPRTINEVLMARIDRLEQKTRDLIKTASVIGRNFFYSILAEVARSIEDIDNRLEYLEEIQLIRERKRMEEVEYLFKHALAQEVAYDSILMQRRKELHRNVAGSIEKVFNKRLHEFYGMLAYHYSQAEDLDKAEEYLIKAGEESLKASASAEALDYYQQALALYLRKYGDKAEPAKVAMMEKNIALALYNRGQYAESIPYFDKILAFYGETTPRHQITKVLKLGVSFLTLLSAFYLPFFHWKKDPTQEDNEFFNLFFKKCSALSATNPKEWFFQAVYFRRRFTKYDFTKIDTGPGFASVTVALLALTGLSFTLSRRVLAFTKNKVDVADARSMFIYQTNVLFHNSFSGEWEDEIEIDQGLIDKNIAIGEFYYLTGYMIWASLVHIERGNCKAAQSLLQQLSDIGETYENDFAKVSKFIDNGMLLMGYRRLHEAMNEIQEGILFIERTGFKVMLIGMYALKARTQIHLGDLNGAEDSFVQAEKIMSEKSVVPYYVANLFLNRFVQNMYLLEEAITMADKVKIKKYRSKAISAGMKSQKIANKYSFTKTETLKLIGTYYWIIGKQRKAMKWWHTAISEGQRMNYRLELSRTYFEVGKRLLEPKSKYKELDGIKADDYLEKARAMFVEMDLQWDLDELEKLKLKVGMPA
jgi:tetratricopeptide (TPR) repeat protein